MAETDITAVLAERHDDILVATKARGRGDIEMVEVAAQRGITESDMAGQVVGFYLQAISTDLALGGTAAIEQNLSWLVRLRDGHGLPFGDHLVLKMFDDVSVEIEACLTDAGMQAQYAGYAAAVRGLIVDAFPGAGGV